MLNNRDRRGAFVHHVKQVPSLHPLPGIVDGMQVSSCGAGKGLDSNQQARLIHHHKHGPHTLVGLSKKQSPALAFAAKRHRAGGITMDSHFFFHTGAGNVIGFSKAAVFVDPNFRNNK